MTRFDSFHDRGGFAIPSLRSTIRCLSLILFAGWQLIAAPHGRASHFVKPETDVAKADPKLAATREAELLSQVRQLTFEGKRAGEGYFSDDGGRMVFQSERDADNPFFQIYLMDLETGDIERISPGLGKTTCSWIHPDGQKILFASTHEDPDARQKQVDEIQLRQEGKQRRYSWDYDAHYDIYQYENQTGQYTNLSNTRGYDAEGSWSPDGKLIAFASNRAAYRDDLSEEDRKKFELDPSYMIDIYTMHSDGTNPRRLTTAPGYDGGPFFSPDGKRICFRRFSENGALAEIMTMNTDGSDQRQITRLGAMSWAPFYHPSGDYLMFTTNRHGFANFELYMIDTAAKSQPVRVTYTHGFDGLPAFSPDGQHLAWTTNRTASKQSHIFLAAWNDAKAREKLGIDGNRTEQIATADATKNAQVAAVESSRLARSDFSSADIVRHVDYLCREELAGRLTGTPGEALATAYVAAYFENLGLKPAGDEGTFFQNFEFAAGVALGSDNKLAAGTVSYQLDRDWRPVSFSATGKVNAAPVVFAGYGTFAPRDDGQSEYDSYVHLDVKDKWVLVFRYVPDRISAKQRQHLFRYASLRYKAMLARDRGARGLILVSGPNSKVKSQLIPMRFDGSLSGASIPVVSVSDDLANDWLKASGKSLLKLQDKLDTGEFMMGFELKGVELSASIDMVQVKRHGRNVLGRLQVGSLPSEQFVAVGAHVDHLGTGLSGSSLARDDEKGAIHYGADDNASGVAAMLEIAEYLANQASQGRLNGPRDVLFAAWSGEEMGLIGSSHFVKTFRRSAPSENGHAAEHPGQSQHSLYPSVAAYLNMDMVGRLETKLILQGIGSSSVWRGEIERRNIPVGLPITLQDDSYLPTDASTFFMRGVPILSAFTGSHADYHTPRDTPNKLNYDGAMRTARLMGLIAKSLALRKDAPDYIAQTGPKEGQRRANLRAYLGTIPDYAESDVKGVKISGVAKNGPAAEGGVQGGDIIVELAGKKIENIYDYTYAIEALKIGQPVKIAVERNGKRMELSVTPGSRE